MLEFHFCCCGLLPLAANGSSLTVPEYDELYFWLRADECVDISKMRHKVEILVMCRNKTEINVEDVVKGSKDRGHVPKFEKLGQIPACTDVTSAMGWECGPREIARRYQTLGPSISYHPLRDIFVDENVPMVPACAQKRHLFSGRCSGLFQRPQILHDIGRPKCTTF